ncbi:MAG: hypothetical protein KY476_23780 [Planctomycetes bacterium]|nr:hypothetical protein [Planctomycetota bacterium]
MHKLGRLIIAALIVLVVGAAFFGVRVLLKYYQIEVPFLTGPRQETTEEPDQVGRLPVERPDGAPIREPREELPVAARPTALDTDEVAALAQGLRERQQAVRQEELELARRQDLLEMFYADVLSEQQQLDNRRQEIETELTQAVVEARQSLEHLRTELKDVREKARLLEEEAAARAAASQVSVAEETANFKKLGAIFDSVEAESAAVIFQELAQGENYDTVVGVLYRMKERQAGKVLAEIETTSKDLAAELMTRLQNRRTREAQPPTAP